MTNAPEVKTLIKYLLANTLTADELLLLYSVYVRREAAADRELISLLGAYYNKRSFYDPEGHPFEISWATIVQKLEREGYLITYPGHARKHPNGDLTVDLSKLDVTDKFKETIISDDREKLWDYYVDEIYGPTITIDSNIFPAALPDKGQTEEQLKTLFWSLCGNGLNERFRELCVNTENYFEYMGRNMKISTFLKAYSANMKALEYVMAQQGSRNTNQSY